MLSAESGYGDRFFYLLLDDTDIVTRQAPLQDTKPWRRYVKALITLHRR